MSGGGVVRPVIVEPPPGAARPGPLRVLMIDNYDSFTFNLVQMLAEQGAPVHVYRNDAITVDEARAFEPTHIVVSPGPGTPDRAGISMAIIEAFAERIPLLGVCLGHQAIAEVYGGRIIRADRLMHGKPSVITHDGAGVYRGLGERIEVGRYHSLTADEGRWPDCLAETSRTIDGELMGLRHRDLPVEGVQFHPESILTPEGARMLANFLDAGGGGA